MKDYLQTEEEFATEFVINLALGTHRFSKEYKVMGFAEVYLQFYRNPEENAYFYDLLKAPALFYVIKKDNSEGKAITKVADLEGFVDPSVFDSIN